MKKPRIMIVEDEILVAEDIRNIVCDFGYSVTDIVDSGEDAITCVKEKTPDLVLMDIMLSGDISGIAAAGKIKRQFDIPVIFLTAHSDQETLDQAKLSEPYGFITKPYDSSDIQNALVFALHRSTVDRELAEYRLELEDKVKEQTESLKKANRKLQNKVRHLEKTSASLHEKSKQLQEANDALNYILKQREQDKIDQSERINKNVNNLVRPYLESLGKTELTPLQKDYISLITENMAEILTPFSQYLSSKRIALTNMELKVADLVKNGKRNKEIAAFLSISPKTVEFYRENIRKKLGLRNKKVNLRNYLHTINLS